MLELICGSAVGITHLILGQPLDYIKVKYQTSSTFENNTHNFTKYIKQIRVNSGILGYYKGSSALIFGLPLMTAIQFSAYQNIKLRLMKQYKFQYGQTPEQFLKLRHIGLAGMISGMVISLLSCPLEYAKVQAQTFYKLQKNSSINILKNQIINNKPSKIYNAFFPTLLREAIGGYFYFSSYEATVRYLCKIRQINRKYAQFKDFFIGGAIAGLSFWAVVYPCDCLKTRIQAGLQNQKSIYNTARVVYRGFPLGIARGVIINSISFAIYEQIKGISELFMLMTLA